MPRWARRSSQFLAQEGTYVDVQSVEDINDIGDGEPLYANFEPEDFGGLETICGINLHMNGVRKAFDID